MTPYGEYDPHDPVRVTGSRDDYEVVRSGAVTSRVLNLRTGRQRTVATERLRPRLTSDTPANASHLPSQVFRSGTAERPRELVEQPKPPKRWRSEAYLKHVRSFPCCVCDKPAPSDPHHYGPGKGMSRKPDDVYTAPLCRWCHDTAHHNPEYAERVERRLVEAQRDCLAEWVRRKGASGV